MNLFLTSAALFLPLVFAVGVLTTFRFAGPVYRFEQFLKNVIAGKAPADCRLRKGDHLQDFCQLLNQATAPLRVQEPSSVAEIQDVDEIPSLVSSGRDTNNETADSVQETVTSGEDH